MNSTDNAMPRIVDTFTVNGYTVTIVEPVIGSVDGTYQRGYLWHAVIGDFTLEPTRPSSFDPDRYVPGGACLLPGGELVSFSSKSAAQVATNARRILNRRAPHVTATDPTNDAQQATTGAHIDAGLADSARQAAARAEQIRQTARAAAALPSTRRAHDKDGIGIGDRATGRDVSGGGEWTGTVAEILEPLPMSGRSGNRYKLIDTGKTYPTGGPVEPIVECATRIIPPAAPYAAREAEIGWLLRIDGYDYEVTRIDRLPVTRDDEQVMRIFVDGGHSPITGTEGQTIYRVENRDVKPA